MINIEELLKPISPEKPCGEDLSYDPAMQELETLLRGKPETQFSQAEEPRWEEVRDRVSGCHCRSYKNESRGTGVGESAPPARLSP